MQTNVVAGEGYSIIQLIGKLDSDTAAIADAPASRPRQTEIHQQRRTADSSSGGQTCSAEGRLHCSVLAPAQRPRDFRHQRIFLHVHDLRNAGRGRGRPAPLTCFPPHRTSPFSVSGKGEADGSPTRPSRPDREEGYPRSEIEISCSDAIFPTENFLNDRRR